MWVVGDGFVHEMKLVYSETWFNTLWRLRTEISNILTANMLHNYRMLQLVAFMEQTLSTLTNENWKTTSGSESILWVLWNVDAWLAAQEKPSVHVHYLASSLKMTFRIPRKKQLDVVIR